MTIPSDSPSDVSTLAALGLSPNTSLMTEPRLFFDARLLSALIVELEDELGFALAARTLFLVGLIHGLREGRRAIEQDFTATDRDLSAEDFAKTLSTGPAMTVDYSHMSGGGSDYEIRGSWPCHHEVEAWLERLGPGDEPTCWLSAGYTSGWLSGTLDAEIIALESSCCGCGEPTCAFEAREQSAWGTRDPDPRLEMLGPIDFALFRNMALDTSSAAPDLLESQGDFDRDGAMVQIWGPVMILPYTSRENLLRTTDALSRDPSTHEINAVVLDLRNEALDDVFDTEAVEQVLASIEAWGAEPILTGVSPLSEEAIHGFESGHLLIRKDLDEAIAAAFLITEAQRFAA